MQNFYDFVKDHPELFRQFSFRELLFLKLDCPPDFTREENWAHYNCFVHVLTGRKNFHSYNKTWQLRQGSTIFIKKGGLTVERAGPEPVCVLLFYVPDDYIRSFIRENISILPQLKGVATNDQAIHVEMNDALRAFYESVLPYFTTSLQPPENLVELKFRELLYQIITSDHNFPLINYFRELSSPAKDDLKEVMENNFYCNLSLKDFARLCHRSLSSFKRDFHSTFGKTPGRWLLLKRLENARSMLVNTEKQVVDIIYETGFNNLSHFDRVFKNQFGSSPLQYRRKHALNRQEPILNPLEN